MTIHLTFKQKLQLERQHDKSRDGRVRDRIKAVLLASEGWSTPMIAQALRIHETTVLRHLKDYQQEAKLAPENGGSASHLSAEQTAELITVLTTQTFPSTLSIVAFVQQQYGITFSVPGMNKWLHRKGFSYKKPVGVPHKMDEARQQQFIEHYENLKETAGDEPILFMDAVHPTQSTKLSYGWIRKGGRKVVKTTGSRTRLNILGMLNLNDISRTIISEYPTINAHTVCQFFIEARKSYPITQRVHVVLDGAGYHRSELVKDWATVMNIELHFLPPYSPNLNPIERLWKVMNEQVRNNRYFATAKQFRDDITKFFKETLPDIADSLRSRLNDNFQLLKTASSD